MLSVTTRASNRLLARVQDVRRRLGLDPAAEQDAVLAELLAAASAAAETYCHRTFAREALSETARGYGGTLLMLTRTPVVAVSSVLLNGEAITDYAVDDPDAGFLYRRLGWEWTAQLGWHLTASVRPRSEEPSYAIAYTAGYLLPSDDVETARVAVDGPAKTLTLSAGSWPLLLPGDVVVTAGFAEAANNVALTVALRTASVLTVAETLATEAESDVVKTIRVSTLPADIEEAVRLATRAWWTSRKRDHGAVVSRSVGDLSISYASPSAQGTATLAALSLPTESAALLAPHVRAA